MSENAFKPEIFILEKENWKLYVASDNYRPCIFHDCSVRKCLLYLIVYKNTKDFNCRHCKAVCPDSIVDAARICLLSATGPTNSLLLNADPSTSALFPYSN